PRRKLCATAGARIDTWPPAVQAGRQALAPRLRVRGDVHPWLRGRDRAGGHPTGSDRSGRAVVRAAASGRDGGHDERASAGPRRGDPCSPQEGDGVMGSRLNGGAEPGRFYDRADIERQVQIPDGRGGYTSGGWQAIPGGSDVPVDIRELSADERIRA